jgi:hypothetical protein
VTACTTSKELFFDQIAVKNGTVIGPTNDGVAWAGPNSAGCWSEIYTWADTLMTFVSIATDNSTFANTASPVLVWGTDASGNISYVNAPCTPTITSCDAHVSCGTIVNNCGQVLHCGGCGLGQTCSSNVCVYNFHCSTPETCCTLAGGVLGDDGTCT